MTDLKNSNGCTKVIDGARFNGLVVDLKNIVTVLPLCYFPVTTVNNYFRFAAISIFSILQTWVLTVRD